MTILFFASYKFKNSDQSWTQGSVSGVLNLDEPNDFVDGMNDLDTKLRVKLGQTVLIENVTMQPWIAS